MFNQLCKVLIVSALFAASTSLSFAVERNLYEDFSSGVIKGSKFYWGEGERRIVGEKLRMHFAWSNHAADENLANRQRQGWTLPVAGEAVHALEMHSKIIIDGIGGVPAISIDEEALVENKAAYAGLSGRFYNRLANPDASGMGDILAGVMIGDRGKGLEAWGWIKEDEKGEGPLFHKGFSIIPPGTLEAGIEYEMGIAFNGINEFTFTVEGTSVVEAGPECLSEVVIPNRQLQAFINTGNDDETVLISTRFDDVRTGYLGEVYDYDHFEGERIDPAKWKQYEYANNIFDGVLNQVVASPGKQITNRMTLREKYSRYLEAKLRISSASEINEGARGRVRIMSQLYNRLINHEAGEQFDGDKGNVYALVGLETRNDGNGGSNLRGIAYIGASNDAAGSDFEDLQPFYVFPQAIEYDRNYIASIEMSEDHKIILKLGDEMIDYVPATDQNALGVYQPSNGWRQVRSRIENGEGGMLVTFIDDIYTDNDVPVLAALATQEVEAGQTVTFTASAKDDDGITGYEWRQSGGDQAVSAETSGSNNNTLSFVMPDADNIEFEVIARDIYGGSSQPQKATANRTVDTATANATATAAVTTGDDSGGGSIGPASLMSLLLAVLAGRRGRSFEPGIKQEKLHTKAVRAMLLVAICLVIGACTTTEERMAKKGIKPMTAGEIKKTISGNSMYHNGDTWEYRGYYKPDGTMIGKTSWDGGEETASGTWEVLDEGLFCRKWENHWGNGGYGCQRWYQDGAYVVFEHAKGVKGSNPSGKFKVSSKNTHNL